ISPSGAHQENAPKHLARRGPCLGEGGKILEDAMMRRGILTLGLALMLTGCGAGTGRTSGTAAGGAATGAVIGLVGGPIGVVVGAGIGAGVGALSGANTTPKQVNLGNAPWDKTGQ
ncbi:hypothetical protein, partial [Acidocella sp.]|uniref:hypothetical protein n=2 Tax=Acidocella sp. TaxID=50710 RepID=UPI00260FF134